MKIKYRLMVDFYIVKNVGKYAVKGRFEMISKWSLAILGKEELSLEDEMRLDKLRREWCRACYEDENWEIYPCDRCVEDWIKPIPERPLHHRYSRKTGVG